MRKAESFNDVVIVFVRGNDARINLLYIIKGEAINVLKMLI